MISRQLFDDTPRSVDSTLIGVKISPEGAPDPLRVMPWWMPCASTLLLPASDGCRAIASSLRSQPDLGDVLLVRI